MTRRQYDFDLMKAGDERTIRCRVSERDNLLKRLRPLCTKYSGNGIRFKAEAVALGVRYWATEPKEETVEPALTLTENPYDK